MENFRCGAGEVPSKTAAGALLRRDPGRRLHRRRARRVHRGGPGRNAGDHGAIGVGQIDPRALLLSPA